jgi:hypothetical protein
MGGDASVSEFFKDDADADRSVWILCSSVPLVGGDALSHDNKTDDAQGPMELEQSSPLSWQRVVVDGGNGGGDGTPAFIFVVMDLLRPITARRLILEKDFRSPAIMVNLLLGGLLVGLEDDSSLGLLDCLAFNVVVVVVDVLLLIVESSPKESSFGAGLVTVGDGVDRREKEDA